MTVENVLSELTQVVATLAQRMIQVEEQIGALTQRAIQVEEQQNRTQQQIEVLATSQQSLIEAQRSMMRSIERQYNTFVLITKETLR